MLIARRVTLASVAAWQASPVRAHWLEQVLAHTVGAQQLHRVSGLERWLHPWLHARG